MTRRSMKIIKIAVLIIAAAGAALNVMCRWEGFMLWMVSNGYWIGYNFKQKEYVQAFLFVMNFGLCIYGAISWQ